MPNKGEYEYLVLDVFTKTRFKGNPLAVLPDAQGLSGEQMQTIAGEFNLSETVFLLPPTVANAAAKARIFTPRRELLFAGHPTIGAASVVSAAKNPGSPFYLEEGVGPVKIDAEMDPDGTPVFWLTTPPVQFFETLDPQFCAELLGLTVLDINASVAPGFVSAGNPFLYICLTSVEAVDRAEVQQSRLAESTGSQNSTGTFFFARKEPQSATNFDTYSRMCAPLAGIAEDPATGSAAGPLAAYMMRHGMLPSDVRVEFVNEQGTKMGRQSLLRVRVDPADSSIRVGGTVVRTARGTLSTLSPAVGKA